MFEELTLQHFKCFERLTLPLRPLTLLTGVNAGGKSTVIQSLALLHQTKARFGEDSRGLLLNGPWVSLGGFGDVVDKRTGRNRFSVALRQGASKMEWDFESDDRNSLYPRIMNVRITSNEEKIDFTGDAATLVPSLVNLKDVSRSTIEWAGDLSRRLQQTSYLCANRVGPRETYAINPSDDGNDFDVGCEGEYTPWFLYNHGEAVVAETLRRGTNPQVRRQVEAWLDYLFPGAGYEVQPVVGANLVTLRMRTDSESEFHRPQNVGYGVSHVLPILAVCLAAPRDNVVMIENPETHLHPSAQAEVGHFAAKVAASGIQVILESHSDHVLNGIRRAVRDETIASEDVAIHFFTPRHKDGAQIISPVVNKKGQLDYWPNGFFDQFDKDLAYFAELG